MSTKLFITIYEMIILTHKKIRFSSQALVEIFNIENPKFKGMDNLMKRLITLFPYCALTRREQNIKMI